LNIKLRTIAVVGAKGGSGKTTTSISIAHAMSRHKPRTILIDGDLSTPNVHLYLGWPVLKKNLVSALNSAHPLKDAIYKHPSGLRVLPSVSSLSEIRMIKHEKLRQAINDLQGETDVILLDSASGLGREALGAIDACDEVLIVTNPELASVVDTQKTVQAAHELGKMILGVVLNKAKGDKHELSIREVERLLGLPVIAVVPFDDAVRKAFGLKSPVTYSHPRSKAGSKYIMLSEMLLGKKYMSSVLKKKTLKDYTLEKLGLS
jgi:septum site-determining protein MinD